MFVLAVRLRAAKGKEKELEELLRKTITQVHQNEKDTLIYDCHRKVDDPSEILMYERYRDKKAWEVTHSSQPYVKELVASISDYIEGEIDVTAYELVEMD
jgi:quinol monooxygenase YgiN